MKQQHIDFIREHVTAIGKATEHMVDMSAPGHRVQALAAVELNIAAINGLLLGLEDGVDAPQKPVWSATYKSANIPEPEKKVQA